MMAELQEQLQAILGDPQAMSQITAIAQALTGGGQPSAPSQEPQAQEVDFVPVETPATPQEAPPPPDLSALLGAMGGGDLPPLDPKLLSAALRIFSEYSAQDDQKAALLAALKPFLKGERLEKLAKAEQVARLSRVVRVAIRVLKEGDDHV